MAKNKVLFDTLAIVGTGLIGGSIALAARRRGLVRRITGVCRSQKSVSFALARGIIDSGSRDLSAVREADLVVFAAPVGSLASLARAARPYVKPGALVTDVGSTKAQVVKAFSRLYPGYIGSHPLAGSEKKGSAFARPDLFQDTLGILTPHRGCDLNARARIRSFWSGLGARVVALSASRHDRLLSFSSHLPHAAAFALMNALPQPALRYAAGGLRDTTRIADSDGTLWTDIFLSNRSELIGALGRFQGELARLKAAVRAQDRRAIRSLLKRAQARRSRLAEITRSVSR